MTNPTEMEGRSPLERLSNFHYGGNTFAQEQLITVGVTRVTLVRNNPNRVRLIMINESASDLRVSIDPNITASSGWLLSALGGVIDLSWDDDGESVGYETYAISPAAGCVVRVREVLVL